MGSIRTCYEVKFALTKATVLTILGLIFEYSAERGPFAGPPTYQLGAQPRFPSQHRIPLNIQQEQFQFLRLQFLSLNICKD